MTLIRAYGEFWQKEALNRQHRVNRDQGRLPGTAMIGGRRVTVDVWRQRGIYVLLSNYKPVYVGKASNKDLGSRLRDHMRDRHAGRWDMFSWYGVLDFKKRGAYGREPTSFTHHGISKHTLIDALEAVGIAITDPPLNRARPRHSKAVRVDQADVDAALTTEGQLKAIWDYVREIKKREASTQERGKRRRHRRRRVKRV
jgi:hypothetical protein